MGIGRSVRALLALVVFALLIPRGRSTVICPEMFTSNSIVGIFARDDTVFHNDHEDVWVQVLITATELNDVGIVAGSRLLSIQHYVLVDDRENLKRMRTSLIDVGTMSDIATLQSYLDIPPCRSENLLRGDVEEDSWTILNCETTSGIEIPAGNVVYDYSISRSREEGKSRVQYRSAPAGKSRSWSNSNWGCEYPFRQCGALLGGTEREALFIPSMRICVNITCPATCENGGVSEADGTCTCSWDYTGVCCSIYAVGPAVSNVSVGDISEIFTLAPITWNAEANPAKFHIYLDGGAGLLPVGEVDGTAREFVLQDLLPSTFYLVRVAGVSPFGVEGTSDDETFTTIGGSAPDPPFLWVASATTSSITVKNSPSSSKGNGIISTFDMFFREVSGGAWTGPVRSGFTVTFSGLTHNTAYEFKSQAFNGVYSSADSDVVVGYTREGEVPHPPSITGTDKLSGTSVLLTWTPPAILYLPVVAYRLSYYPTASGTGARVEVADTVDTSFTFVGLPSEVTLEVMAVNMYGASIPASTLLTIAPCPGECNTVGTCNLNTGACTCPKHWLGSACESPQHCGVTNYGDATTVPGSTSSGILSAWYDDYKVQVLYKKADLETALDSDDCAGTLGFRLAGSFSVSYEEFRIQSQTAAGLTAMSGWRSSTATTHSYIAIENPSPNPSAGSVVYFPLSTCFSAGGSDGRVLDVSEYGSLWSSGGGVYSTTASNNRQVAWGAETNDEVRAYPYKGTGALSAKVPQLTLCTPSDACDSCNLGVFIPGTSVCTCPTGQARDCCAKSTTVVSVPHPPRFTGASGTGAVTSVAFVAHFNGNTPITSFTVRVYDRLGAFVMSASGTGSPIVVSTLFGQTYTFGVLATNDVGSSAEYMSSPYLAPGCSPRSSVWATMDCPAGVPEGSTCSETCAPGLVVNTVNVTCTGGVWDSATSCTGCYLTLPPETRSTCAGMVSEGVDCTVTCAGGFTGGSEVISCAGGVFSGTMPVCAEVSGCEAVLGSTLSGIVFSNCSGPVSTGTTCGLECGLARGHLVCTGQGYWSGPGVQCTVPLPDCPLRLGTFVTSDCAIDDVHFVGTRCVKSCPPEFGVTPVDTECLAGSPAAWSAKDPVCTAIGTVNFVAGAYFVDEENFVFVEVIPALSTLPGTLVDSLEMTFASSTSASLPGVYFTTYSPDTPLRVPLACEEGEHNFVVTLVQSERLLYSASSVRVVCQTRATVQSWTPTGSSVDPNKEIILTFNKPVNASSIEAMFSLTSTAGGMDLPVTSAWGRNNTEATFYPTTQTPNAEYMVNVSGGVGLDGTPLVPFSFTYRTTAFIYFVLPLADALDVDTAQYVTVAFRERMNESVTEHFFSVVKSSTGEEVEGMFAWTRGTIFLFTPDQKFEDSSEYEVSLNVGTQSILGETMNYPYLWRFTTRRVAPRVVSSSPADADEGVPISATIGVTFDKAIDITSFESAFTLTTRDGAIIDGTASLVSEVQARFTTAAELPDSTVLEASVSTALTDVHGNALAQSYDWSFVTVDETPPFVVASDPAPGAVMVPLDASLSIEFSETMQLSTVDIILQLDPEVISTSIGWSADARTITLYPERQLEDSVPYEIIIHAAADLGGLGFTGPDTIAFTTAPKCDPECENGVCVLRNLCTCDRGYGPPGLPLEAGETACKTPARLTSVSPTVLPPSGGDLRVDATLVTSVENYLCTFEVEAVTFVTNATVLSEAPPSIICPAPTAVSSVPTLMFLTVSSVEGTLFDNSLTVTMAQCEEGLVVRDGTCEDCPGKLVTTFELSSDQSECVPCNPGQVKTGKKCAPASAESLLVPAEDGGSGGGGVSAVALVMVILFLLLLGAAIVGGVWMHMQRKNNMRFYIDEDATVRVDAGQNGKSESLVKKMLAKASTNRIGGGEYADIFAAKMDSKAWVALKVLNTGSTVARDEFHREAMALSKIQQNPHPAVIQLIFYMALNPTCIAMELCDRGSVKDLLKKKKMPIPRKVRIATEVASGMLYIHSLDIAHLDLKTDNIMLMSDGTSRIIDFGICKSFDGEVEVGGSGMGPPSAGSRGHTSTPLMNSGGGAGTLQTSSVPAPPPVHMDSLQSNTTSMGVDEEAYMQRMSSAFAGGEMTRDVAVDAFSPRYCDPGRLSAEYTTRSMFFAADVYSFAMVMWAMYSQTEPYTGVSVKELTGRLRDRPAMRPIVSAEWHKCYGELIQRCWAKSPGDRPVFLEIARVLDECARSDFDVELDDEYFPSGMERGTQDEADFQAARPQEMDSAAIQSIE